MKLLAELQARGLVAQVTEPALDGKLAELARQGVRGAYCGFDPTADSLHVGNLLPIVGLMHVQKAGLRPIAVVGGATGLIGDPGGKTSERPLQTKEAVARNVAGIRKVLERFLDFNHPTAPAAIVNNLDWLGPMSAIDFLRDVGKHFRVGVMLAKDSVKNRMTASEEGMSYTEFSYQLLQGYDFYHLYKQQGCVLQIGGADQWGNITAGTDLIRKLEGESGSAFGLTLPLITTASGVKFGKSEGNAVWLSADRTSPYDFYQYWLRCEDADAGRYLRFFTFVPLEEIAALEERMRQAPEERAGQHRLAEVMTELVHGPEALERAKQASRILFGQPIEHVDEATLAAIFADVPSVALDRNRLAAGWPVLEAIVEADLAKSKGEARRLITQGGFYVNNQPWKDATGVLTQAQLATPSALVLRAGKKNYRLIKVA